MTTSVWFSDDKWRKIEFFLNAKRIKKIDQIDDYIIDELYFVPGVDYTLIEELRQKYVEKNEMGIQSSSVDCSFQEVQVASHNRGNSSKKINPEQKTSFWFSDYPWQMLLGKNFKVKNAVSQFLIKKNIFTIKDFEPVLPISRHEIPSGISDDYFESFNHYMKSKLNLLKETTSFEEIDRVVDGLNWQNFYSKIDLDNFAKQIPSPILSGQLKTIFELFRIPVNKRINKRVGNDTLREFLIDRVEYELFGIGKIELYRTYDSLFESLRILFLSPQKNSTKRYTFHISEPLKSLRISNILDIFVENNNDKKAFENVLKKYEIESIDNLTDIELNISDYTILLPMFEFLEKNYVQDFINSIEALSENRKRILEGRVLGDSLQIIAEGMGITRERVRQIETLILTKLLKNVDILARVLSRSNDFFYFSDVEKLFQEEYFSLVFVWVLDKKSIQYEYLKFADLIVSQNITRENMAEKFLNIVEAKASEIGDIVNLYSEVSFDLKKNDLYFISLDNFDAFLNRWLKFKIMNGIYIKSGVLEVELLAYIIEEEFRDGIKLDSREDNKDLISLRKHVQRNFPKIKLPDNNRALTARIIRSERMVLRDRGVYISSSQIYIEDSLREEIFSWINKKGTTLTYNEVFENFKSRLFMESNIDNGNFLHGMLKHYYSDHFTFSRDYFTKINGEVVTTDERIINLLKKNGTMTEQEITNEIPGLKAYQIFSICDRNAKIFRAGIKKIALIDQVHFCDSDLVEIEQFMKKLLVQNKGYISSKYLFDKLFNSNLNKIIIENSDLDDLGIYQFLLKKLSNSFSYRYPHIIDKQSEIQIKNLESSTILENLFVNESEIISREELEQFKLKFQWSQLTIYAFLNESKQNLIRISKSQYATLEKSGVTDNTVRAIDRFFDNRKAAYYPIIDFNNFDLLPAVTFEWNHFLLEDIITKFSNNYRLIDREKNGSHFVSSIVVENSSDLKDFEDVVIFELNKTGKRRFSSREIREYLSNRGLITNVIPQELVNGKRIKFNSRSEMFEMK